MFFILSFLSLSFLSFLFHQYLRLAGCTSHVITPFVLLRLKPTIWTHFDFILFVFEVLLTEEEMKKINSKKKVWKLKKPREKKEWIDKKKHSLPFQNFHRDLEQSDWDTLQIHDSHSDNGSNTHAHIPDTPPEKNLRKYAKGYKQYSLLDHFSFELDRIRQRQSIPNEISKWIKTHNNGECAFSPCVDTILHLGFLWDREVRRIQQICYKSEETPTP